MRYNNDLIIANIIIFIENINLNILFLTKGDDEIFIISRLSKFFKYFEPLSSVVRFTL